MTCCEEKAKKAVKELEDIVDAVLDDPLFAETFIGDEYSKSEIVVAIMRTDILYFKDALGLNND